jgi:hypothetical protein
MAKEVVTITSYGVNSLGRELYQKFIFFPPNNNAEPICHVNDKTTTTTPSITRRRLILSRR